MDDFTQMDSCPLRPNSKRVIRVKDGLTVKTEIKTVVLGKGNYSSFRQNPILMNTNHPIPFKADLGLCGSLGWRVVPDLTGKGRMGYLVLLSGLQEHCVGKRIHHFKQHQ